METRYLCDTQVLIWAGGFAHKLSAEVRSLMENPSVPMLASAVSVAEMAIKSSIGKLALPVSPQAFCAAGLYVPWPLTWEHADRLQHLPLHHRDPFDRMLIAQALVDDLTMITADASFDDYEGLKLVRAD